MPSENEKSRPPESAQPTTAWGLAESPPLEHDDRLPIVERSGGDFELSRRTGKLTTYCPTAIVLVT